MREMRRKDRALDREQAMAIIDKSRFAALAMISPEGTPYCVTLSVARDQDQLYFHAAFEGYKTDCLRHSNKVCLSFVGDISFPPDKFTAYYESAVVFGTAQEVINDDEKRSAIELICRRFTPANMAAFDKGADRYPREMAIWKIHIDEISGKKNGRL